MLKRFLVIAAVIIAISVVCAFIYFEINKRNQMYLKDYHPPTGIGEPRINEKGEKYHCPESVIAGFDFTDLGPGSVVINEADDVVRTYGEGCVDRNKEHHGAVHRYYDEKSKIYIELGFNPNCGRNGCLVNIKLTTEKIASQTCAPKVKFKSLMTKKGVKIGDSETMVRKIYGNPTAIYKLNAKYMFMGYSDEVVYKTAPSESLYPGHMMGFTLDKDKGKVIGIEMITGD